MNHVIAGRPRPWRPAALLLAGLLLLGCDEGTGPPPEVASIQVTPDSAILDAGRDRVQFRATALDEAGGEIEGVTFSWAVSDTAIATVDGDGWVSAAATGLAAVSASAEAVTGEAVVRVHLSTGYFVCECGAGSAAGCQAGDDDATGRSPYTPFESYQRARARFSSLAAGDTIRFCEGGAFPITGANTERRWVNDRCRAESPCVVTSYPAPWGAGDEDRPLLTAQDGHGMALEDGGDADHEEGYVFENLTLRCTSCGGAGWGFFLYNDIDHVVLQDVEIDGFALGVYVGESNPCADPACDGVNAGLTIRRARIVNSSTQGFLGAGDSLVIEDSYFENNGTRAFLDHNIYLGGVSHGARISRNELFRSALNEAGSCSGVSLVAHGEHTDLVNLIYEEVGKAEPGCWGIAVDPAYEEPERFQNVVIRRNEIRHVGNLGIGVASCVDCLIENNVVVNAQPFAVTGIAAPDRAAGPGDADPSNVDIRNNSILIAAAGGAGIRVGGLGTGNLVGSNAVLYTGAAVDWYCMEVVLPDGTDIGTVYEAVGHNLCWASELGAGGQWERYTGTDPDPLTAWQNASGLGAGSIWADPEFADALGPDYNLRPASSASPLVDNGHPSLSAPTDISGAARDDAPDLGAYEGGGG